LAILLPWRRSFCSVTTAIDHAFSMEITEAGSFLANSRHWE
jgi:hypothetical protein